MQDTAEDVPVLPIVQPAPTAQDVGTAVVVERVVFVAVALLEEVLLRATLIKKVRLKNIGHQVLMNLPKQNPINQQKYLLMKLISILVPATDTRQE